MKNITLFFCSYSILFAFVYVQSKSLIALKNNGYQDIVVAFSPSTEEKYGKSLIPQIKQLFIESSEYLFEATRHLAYFSHVIILVPKQWQPDKQYQKATFENFLQADVRIDEPNAHYGDDPYTLQPFQCGEPGKYIHLTPKFLESLRGKSTKLFGEPGKILLREWAQFRYGIFEEYARNEDPQFPSFYYDSTLKEIIPNSCTNSKLNGIYWNSITNEQCNIDDSIPHNNCHFIPDPNNNATSSIASIQYLPTVHKFCDDTTEYPHNHRAPNKHNIVCQGRSTWNVISNHEDFKEHSSPLLANKVPPLSFQVVQQIEDTYSVVLDVSTSMNQPSDYSKLQIVKDVISGWLLNEVQGGNAVGIVTFSTIAEYQGTMKRIVTNEDRSALIAELPRKATGLTCISCGLIAAVNQLKEYRHGLGGTILLLTDGEDNIQPYALSILPDLVSARVRIVSIALTDDASHAIETLAEATGGKAFSVPLNTSIRDMGSAFFDSTTLQSGYYDFPVKILDEVFDSAENVYNGSFIIDATIGEDTMVKIHYMKENDVMQVKINGPNVNTSNNDNAKVGEQIVNDPLTRTVQFKFSHLTTGIYHFLIIRKGTPDQTITVSVTSKPSKFDTKPIVTYCWVAKPKVINGKLAIAVYAEVKQSNNPVIKATVMAKIDAPNGNSYLLQLLDNGNTDPDITKDDGIYSRYFLKYSEKGRYTFKAQVIGTEQTSIEEMDFIVSRSSAIESDPKYETKVSSQKKQTGSFQRIANGGSLLLLLNQSWTSDEEITFPPQQIRNLRISTVEVENFTLTLEWTAPGNQLDDGKIAAYDLRYWDNWDALVHNFDRAMQLDLNYNPHQAGSEEATKITLPEPESRTTYFLAIKSYDQFNVTSHLSNIVQVTFNGRTSITSTLVTGLTASSEPTAIPSEETTTKTRYLSDTEIAIVFGIVIAVLVVVTVVLAVSMAMLWNRYHLYPKQHTKREDEIMIIS